MTPPLVIVGPTSSGKTSFSFWLADNLPKPLKKNGVDILVVDSKQIYKGQDIVTGKDIPESFRPSVVSYQHETEDQKEDTKNLQCFFDGKTRLFGIDLAAPNEDWSVADFLSYAQLVRDISIQEDRQLFIVGGTPLYTLSLFNAPETAVIKPNSELRGKLELHSVEELQARLKKQNSRRFKNMNPSDQKNPRRLIRAIEIEIGRSLQSGWLPTKKVKTPLFISLFSQKESHWIGLSVNKEEMENRIYQRVIQRLQSGALEEYQKLLAEYPDWKPEAKLALGYFDIERYLQNQTTYEELVSLWTKHEEQYAKRQMTWWKREKQIKWFDPKDPAFKQQVLLQVKDWYNV